MDPYIQVTIHLPESAQEEIIGQLLGIGYDSFAEFPDQLEAYIPTAGFNENELKEVLASSHPGVQYTFADMEIKNWNEEWEKNFEPLLIGDQCYVRASFHPPRPEVPYELIINPKMSFGTGHHGTTSMMIEFELETDLKGKTVVDAGCGTGILSILAEKKGASLIKAFDIEDWAFENLHENCNLNGCDRIETGQGTISQILQKDEQFDIILANINKNVLLDEMEIYFIHLKQGGTLFLSGFYEEDEADILRKATSVGFEKVQSKTNNRWMSLKLKK